MNYEDYLKSDTWRILRKKRLQLDHFRCCYCGKVAKVVHHLKYIYPKKDKLKNVRSMCNDCHEWWHKEFETLPVSHTEDNFHKFIELKFQNLSRKEIKIYFINKYRREIKNR